MKFSVAAIVAASLWLSATCSFAQSRAQPPAAAFGRVPALGSAALSPSGQLVAWVDNSVDEPLVEIFDLAKGATSQRFSIPAEIKLRGLHWADDEILLIYGSVTHTLRRLAPSSPYEWFRILAMDVKSGKSQILLHTGGSISLVTGSQLLALHAGKPKTVIMSSWNYSDVNYRMSTGSRLAGGRKDRGWTYNLYEVDTVGGTGKLLHAGTPFTFEWIVDANGDAVVRSEWEAQRPQYTLMHRRPDGGWAAILRLETGETPTLLGPTRDGSAVLMAAALDRKHIAIWRVPVDGTAPQVEIGDEANDIIEVVRDPYSLEVLGGWVGGLAPQIRWIDEPAAKRAQSLQKTFGGKQAAVIGRSADGSRALVSVGSHSAPPIYYLVDFKRKTADIVGEEYPELVDVPLGEVRDLTYKARDGYEIPAYLTLPAATKAEKLPLVVMPHGGPEAHDAKRFDFVAQFLATRGYAVLQPQFRGSTGFGEAHRRAGYRQWGGLMQDDVTDGVRALVEQGIADSGRVCIAGISYGGYAALAGATFTPELYACAISVNGISDLPNMLGYERTTGGKESDSVAYWTEHIGPISEVGAKSPARAASRVRAPVLLIHGSDDSVVPIAQSRTMMKALRDQALPHQLIELPGEDHWLSRSATRIRVLTEMEKFLSKHLPVAGEGGG